jgi:hypothetical protein
VKSDPITTLRQRAKELIDARRERDLLELALMRARSRINDAESAFAEARSGALVLLGVSSPEQSPNNDELSSPTNEVLVLLAQIEERPV